MLNCRGFPRVCWRNILVSKAMGKGEKKDKQMDETRYLYIREYWTVLSVFWGTGRQIRGTLVAHSGTSGPNFGLHFPVLLATGLLSGLSPISKVISLWCSSSRSLEIFTGRDIPQCNWKLGDLLELYLFYHAQSVHFASGHS